MARSPKKSPRKKSSPRRVRFEPRVSEETEYDRLRRALVDAYHSWAKRTGKHAPKAFLKTLEGNPWFERYLHLHEKKFKREFEFFRDVVVASHNAENRLMRRVPSR